MTYHSNLYNLYPPSWIDEYRESILNQTYQDVDIYELNYGSSVGMIFWTSTYISQKFPTFVHGMNHLLDLLFNEHDYDCVLNTNCDDKYDENWVASSLEQIKKGYDLVSCNFFLMNESGVYHTHQFAKHNIEEQLMKGHNIICHPGICYSRKFWERGNRYNPDEIPYEDLKLWQRAIKNSRFIIQPQHLVYHRVHDKSVCKTNNR